MAYMNMQDHIYNQITGRKRPSVFAFSALALLAMAALWLVSLAASRLPEGSGDTQTLVNLLYYLPFVLLPIVLYARREGLSESLRLNPLPLSSALLVTFLALVSVFIASAVSAAWEALMVALGVRYAPAGYAPATGGELTLSVLTMAALPAVCEELLFRGVGMAAWEGRGTRRAILVTALLFALMHANLLGFPVYMLIGVVSAWLVYALDTLYAGIVFHTVYNAGCLIVLYWIETGASGAAQTAEAAPGVTFGMVLELVTMAFLAAMILITLNLRRRLRGIEPIPRIPRPLSGRDRWMTALLAAALAAAQAFTIVAVNLKGGVM